MALKKEEEKNKTTNTKYKYKSQTKLQNAKYKTQIQKKNTKDAPAPASPSWQTNLCLIFLRSTQRYILLIFFERTLHNIWYFVEKKERTDFCDH